MKIGIIELETHGECLYSFCKIFENAGHEINIYVKDRIFNELKDETFVGQYHWQLRGAQESAQAFLQQQRASINANDIVFIATVDQVFRAFSTFDFRPPTVLRIHNVNAWFQRNGNLRFKFTPYFLFKDFSYLIRIALLGRDGHHIRNIVRKTDYLTFPTPSLERNALLKSALPPEKIGPVIPLAVFDPSFVKAPHEGSLTITVPGAIDERRRDYPMLLRVWRAIAGEFRKPVQLIFLGEKRGKFAQKTAAAFEKLQDENFRFTSFDRRVAQTEFNRILSQTDVLFSPILLDTRYKIYHEKYGYTKIAAIESDMIRYGKPAILPSAYPISGPLREVILQYNSAAQLKELLLDIVNRPVIAKITRRIPEIMQVFSADRERAEIVEFFNKAIRSTKDE